MNSEYIEEVMTPDIIEQDSVVVEMPLKEADVRRYYSANNEPLSVQDVVVHIRSIHPSPLKRVVLDTELALPYRELEDLFIYVKGVNDSASSKFGGLGSYCYCPLRVDEEAAQQEDFGIRTLIAKYASSYGVDNLELLVYGEDDAMLLRVWEYVRDNPDIKQRAFFPRNILSRMTLMPNGFDIVPYANRIKQAKREGKLSTKFLLQLMAELRSVVESGKTAIQHLEPFRSEYAKWLTLCLTMEYDLSPVYLNSYISEYVNMKVAYPFDKLSFNERFNFVQNLPDAVGYVVKNQEFYCILHVRKRIMPNPAVVFDIASGQVIYDNLERFAWDKVTVLDHRQRFPDSKEYFVTRPSTVSSTALAASDRDKSADEELCNMFANMTDAVERDEVFLSIRNTAFVTLDGKLYLIYCNESFGIQGVLQSPYFGSHIITLYEEDFVDLIDLKLVIAMRKREEQPNSADGDKVFTGIMLKAARTFQPAIPTFVLMCSELAGSSAEDFSYYDRRLRCDKNILPIVTHLDSELHKVQTVFDYVDLRKVRRDKLSAKSLTSFGTLNSETGPHSKLRVGLDTFRGCSLL